ncbi:MAG TPA: rhomboid family intramembrane serine protease [Candidatus Angelobacter sp.]|nr:rhomboid family intramembrane serine protease [Candidatus Angelobacter sp.]
MIPLRDDNPTTIPPVITIGIIGLCALVFLWQQTLSQDAGTIAVYAYGVVPAVLFGNDSLPPGIARIPAELSIFTSMFMHGGWMHIIGNMLYLWIFGNNIEDTLGHVRFVLFYLLCGVAAALAQSLINTHSEVPMIGASGAIAGVLGAYMVLFPRAHVLVLVPFGFFTQLLRLPALLVLGFWFVLQLFEGGLMAPGGEGGVAHWAHIGGFVAGILLVFLLRPRPPAAAPWARRGPWG